MQSLLTVGTSAGGRQPKAVIAINSADGEIRSGQISDLDGYDYYLLKFGNADFNSAELEMTYYDLAIKAGINMMHSELLTVDGSKHFMTQRFDRKMGRSFILKLWRLCILRQIVMSNLFLFAGRSICQRLIVKRFIEE